MSKRALDGSRGEERRGGWRCYDKGAVMGGGVCKGLAAVTRAKQARSSPTSNSTGRGLVNSVALVNPNTSADVTVSFFFIYFIYLSFGLRRVFFCLFFRGVHSPVCTGVYGCVRVCTGVYGCVQVDVFRVSVKSNAEEAPSKRFRFFFTNNLNLFWIELHWIYR